VFVCFFVKYIRQIISGEINRQICT